MNWNAVLQRENHLVTWSSSTASLMCWTDSTPDCRQTNQQRKTIGQEMKRKSVSGGKHIKCDQLINLDCSSELCISANSVNYLYYDVQQRNVTTEQARSEELCRGDIIQGIVRCHLTAESSAWKHHFNISAETWVQNNSCKCWVLDWNCAYQKDTRLLTFELPPKFYTNMLFSRLKQNVRFSFLVCLKP